MNSASPLDDGVNVVAVDAVAVEVLKDDLFVLCFCFDIDSKNFFRVDARVRIISTWTK